MRRTIFGTLLIVSGLESQLMAFGPGRVNSGASSGVVAVTPTVRGGRVYQLAEGSDFQKGCFGFCLCPIIQWGPVRGTFVLRFIGREGPYRVFAVEDVNWTVSVYQPPELRITGSGTYRVSGGPVPTHRLELDLAVGDLPVEHFDSGVVSGRGLPFISVTLSIHGMYCFDTVIEVMAAPVPREEIVDYGLAPETAFVRGCFEPCDCPSGEPQLVTGTFSLVESWENSLFREFAVVDVRWVVASVPGFPPKTPISGFGIYRVGGEFAVQHQVSLDLRVGDEPLTHYDSGWVVGGSNFPDIDALISIHGLFCFDTAIDIHATPAR